MRKTPIQLIGSALLLSLLSGCIAGVKARSLGRGPLPVYEEPAALEFTDDEKDSLKAWHGQKPDLFGKIQGQSHSYRETVRTHNKHAREHNRNLMKEMGFDQAAIDAAYPVPQEVRKP